MVRQRSARSCGSTRRRGWSASLRFGVRSRPRTPPPRSAGSRDEKAAVVTSIGPGALQALAASLVPASDGLGVWYLFGDETTEDEGFNMQQIPRHEQGLFLRLASTMGAAYTLHTPLALPTALRRGAATVGPSHSPRAFLPAPPDEYPGRLATGVQPGRTAPVRPDAAPGPAARRLRRGRTSGSATARRPLVKVGGGGTPRRDRSCSSSSNSPAPSSCTRRSPPAASRTHIRGTCASAARRAHCAATSPWRTPTC